ncbi:MAG: hypothetical protein ACXW18_12765 [Pyrinomonadaceae bacterium]
MVKKMILAVLLLSFSTIAFAQKKEKKPAPTGERVLWREPADIESRDLFLRPGGETMKPDLTRVTFEGSRKGF